MTSALDHGTGGWNIASYFVDRHLDEGRGDAVALVTPAGAVTYAALAALVNRCGNVLRDLGVEGGDRVLLALSDGEEFVAWWYACQKIGAVTAECYTFLQAKDYAYYLAYTEARVVIADATTLPALREAAGMKPVVPELNRLVVGVGDSELRDGELSYASLTRGAGVALSAAAVGRDDIAIWKFTTGSTGSPKACPHRASHPFASFDAYALGVLGMQESDRVLAVPKLFFGYARDLAALYPFGVGATGIVFPERPTPELLFELIARHRPTILVNVPTMMAAMVSHPEAGSNDLSSLRICTSAGEALPAELHRRWLDTFGVEVLDGIGSSEAYHIYISNRPGRVKLGTVGEIVPGYSARILPSAPAGGGGDEAVGDGGGASDSRAGGGGGGGGGGPGGPDDALPYDDLPAVPDGEIGRLAITGPTAASGYHGDDEKSRRTFRGDTVITEDLFVRDGDGYFTYVGRGDDLLKVSGIWVAPAEIEDCLLAHPRVAECAVTGRESEGLMKTVAYVVLTESARSGSPEGTTGAPTAPGEPGVAALAEELRAFVRQRLAPHKCPREVRFLPELPRTANGKIDRRVLRGLS